MIFEILVCFVATCGFSSAQVPPNPLFFAQDAINVYHDYYEDMKVEIRGYMSDYNRAISGEILEILTTTMDTWRRQQDDPDLLSTPEVGETIRSCMEVVFNTMWDHKTAAFDGLEEWHDYITGLQTSVVRKLVDYDILRRYDYFLDDFNPVIEEAHNRLQFEFVPAMESHLVTIRDSQEVITNNFRQCIETVLLLK